MYKPHLGPNACWYVSWEDTPPTSAPTLTREQAEQLAAHLNRGEMVGEGEEEQ